ncbi:hypothetical protein NBRC116188_26480 [Oceaniserpentilla sp. 4NH20-0058]
MIYFNSEFELSEKIGLFGLLLIILWMVYFLMNMLFHRLSLRKHGALEAYLRKDEVEGGEN